MNEHTPHSTANMLEITPVTLRRWCAAHAEFLSPGANPPERGEARRFTGRDIEVLKHIKSLRAQGKTEAKINEQLRTLTFPEIEIIDTPGLNENNTLEGPPSLRDTQDAFLTPVRLLDDLEKRIEAKFEALEQRTRPPWWWLVAGIGIGLGLALVFELAALVAQR